MTKTEYREYIGSTEWRERRDAFLSLEGNDRCSRCFLPRWLAVIAYDQDLHVHHKNYSRIGHEHIADLESLCKRCHEIETFNSSSLHAPQSRPCEHCGEPNFNRFISECAVCEKDLYADDYVRNTLSIAPKVVVPVIE